MTLNDRDFKDTPLFDVDYLRNDTIIIIIIIIIINRHLKTHK